MQLKFKFSFYVMSDLQYVKNKTKSVNNVFQKEQNINLLLALIVRYLVGFFQNVKSTSNKSKINQRWKL